MTKNQIFITDLLLSNPIPSVFPTCYKRKEDIEISGFLTASIAWGNRKMILRNAREMMRRLDNSPYEFIADSTDDEFASIGSFVHRTFNSTDLCYFLKALRHIYKSKGGIEAVFNACQTSESLQPALHAFHQIFFELPHEKRTERHVPDPFRGSAAKRMNMFLRWMIRRDGRGVDFGLWKSISPSVLSCPLDVHSGNVARKLGILTRKQNDAKAVSQLDMVLRTFDSNDPVKYDFALFGLGVFERF